MFSFKYVDEIYEKRKHQSITPLTIHPFMNLNYYLLYIIFQMFFLIRFCATKKTTTTTAEATKDDNNYIIVLAFCQCIIICYFGSIFGKKNIFFNIIFFLCSTLPRQWKDNENVIKIIIYLTNRKKHTHMYIHAQWKTFVTVCLLDVEIIFKRFHRHECSETDTK